MATMQLKITRESGENTVSVLPGTIVDFERHYSCSLGETRTMEHMYYLAWSAEFRALEKAGSERKQFDDWLDDILDVDDVTDDTKRPTGGRSRSSSRS